DLELRGDGGIEDGAGGDLGEVGVAVVVDLGGVHVAQHEGGAVARPQHQPQVGGDAVAAAGELGVGDVDAAQAGAGLVGALVHLDGGVHQVQPGAHGEASGDELVRDRGLQEVGAQRVVVPRVAPLEV